MRWLVLVAVAACADEVGHGALEAASSSGQGDRFNGDRFNGDRFNGTELDGSTLGDVGFAGATHGGAPVAEGSLAGTRMTIWKQQPDLRWEQRTPTTRAIWNATRTRRESFETVDLQTEVSPLGGTRFRAKITRPDGTQQDRTLQIAATVGAVQIDTTAAMFPLEGSSSSACEVVACDHPHGCRTNCNLVLYDVRIYDAGTWHPICPDGELAMAVPGAYAETGEYTPSTRMTFACTGGTIAKCTRWGYRSWDVARPCNAADCSAAAQPLVDHHRACIRAAMADYCATGESFTHPGTMVDIYDYAASDPQQRGFVPATKSLDPTATAFLFEAEFDRHGASAIDFQRYWETGWLETACPGRFDWFRYTPPGHPDHVSEREAPAVEGPLVTIASSPPCAHSEHTAGKWLDHRCSSCTRLLANLPEAPYAHCFEPNGGAWDASCVGAAAFMCSASQRMTAHGECTAGAKLARYGSGCTATVCAQHPSCCTGKTTWSSACVAAANELCRGGLETATLGFCGAPLP